MRPQHKILLAGMLPVALAFGIAIPLGFWIRPRYSVVGDQIFGAMLAVTLVGIAAGAMRLLVGPLWPAKKGEIGPARPLIPTRTPTRTGPATAPVVAPDTKLV